MTSKAAVVVVDDSSETRALWAKVSEGAPGTVEAVPDLRTAMTRIQDGCCDVVVTGLGTSTSEDLRTLRRLRRTHPRVKMIVLTAEGEPEAVLAALREHAFSYFSRPISPDDFRTMVERALAEPDWNDGIEVISSKPEWIAVRAKCRMLTADRLLRFLDEVSIDLSDDDRQNMGTAFREILLNAIEHGEGTRG